MMYSNNCVLAILHKGNVLRESGNEVHLPFGSEYKIRLKNNYGLYRVQAEVKVDGTLIHPEHQRFVIEKGGTLDLERMILDGNLNNGPKLKFVELSDSRVQDPTHQENGIVEVSFYKEKSFPEYRPIKPLKDFETSQLYDYRGDIGVYYACNNVIYADCYSNINCSVSNGATVEGGNSGQGFSHTEDFEVEWLPTVLRLKLIGYDKPQLVKNTRNKFCDKCGRKNRFKAGYCSQCGRKF